MDPSSHPSTIAALEDATARLEAFRAFQDHAVCTPLLRRLEHASRWRDSLSARLAEASDRLTDAHRRAAELATSTGGQPGQFFRAAVRGVVWAVWAVSLARAEDPSAQVRFVLPLAALALGWLSWPRQLLRESASLAPRRVVE